jgi:hypothetical protein
LIREVVTAACEPFPDLVVIVVVIIIIIIIIIIT